MADGQDQDDKQYEPSQKKLDDARRKGEVPRSSDLTTAAAYGGFILVAVTIGAPILRGAGATMAGLLARAFEISGDMFGGGGQAATAAIMAEIGVAFLPWVAGPAAFALLATIALRGFTIAPQKLLPKFDRIDPLANAKNKFGRAGLFEFAKSFAKLTIYSTVLAVFLWRRMPEMLGTLALTPALATAVLLDLGVRFFTLVLLIAVGIGGVDFLWQYQEHLRKNRMSRQEVVDEAKENEGDPQMKHKRRQKGYEIAMNRMLADVPTADVVVVNPTHYAVALKWSRLPGEAPVCVAKGIGEVAARIRAIAAEAGVPVHSDPPTARAIYASIEIGAEIRPEHYQPIAAAIRFAEEMRRKMRARMGQGGPAGSSAP